MRIVIGGAVGALVLSLAACGGSGTSSASEQETQRQADLYAIGQIQKAFHEALSTKDIELMMKIWAPDATITVAPGQTLAGTKNIRNHWLNSKPFQPTTRWVSETPSYKIRVTANGNRGTLFFECHMIDTKTTDVAAVSGADTMVARIDGQWLITSFVGATGTLSP